MRDISGPDYQRRVLDSIPLAPTTGVFYRLDDMLGRARVLEQPTLNEADKSSDVVFSYEFSDGAGLISALGEIHIEHSDGVLTASVETVEDYLYSVDFLAISKDDIGEIAIRVRSRSGKNLRLAWSKGPPSELTWWQSIRTPLIADSTFHTYFINARNVLRQRLEEGDRIRSLMLQPSDVVGDEVDIDFIRFVSNRSNYLRQPRGVVQETIAAEVRQALYMLPRQVLEYSVRLPTDGARLDFGSGIVGSASAVEFAVELEVAGEAVMLHSEVVEDSTRWHDARYDLSEWAGREAKLRLFVDGVPGSVALWSNPIVSGDPVEPLRVIMILEDTMRADHLSVYGYRRETTPFKKRLLSEHEIAFSNAQAQATKTRPSVPSMMTSLLPTATGVWNFTDMLDPAYVTLAEVLRSKGFVTASFVQNGSAGPYAGLHQGFEVAFDGETTGERPEDLLSADSVWRWIDRHEDRNLFTVPPRFGPTRTVRRVATV